MGVQLLQCVLVLYMDELYRDAQAGMISCVVQWCIGVISVSLLLLVQHCPCLVQPPL